MGLVKSVKQYLGVLAINPPDTIPANRAPGAGDINYRKFQIWLDQTTSAFWMYDGAGTWTALGSGTTGSINTLTADSGGALPPTAGNMDLLGTANQITTTGSGSTITWTLPAVVIAPGSLAATTTFTAGTGITATTGNIVATAGNISTTAGSISSHTTLSAGTTITATLGAITATNGNLVLGTAGNKLLITAGANASVGVSGAMSGSPGAIAVATTACTASSVILFSRATTGGTPGQVSITAQSTSGFTLTSTGNETSTFNWLIIN